MILPLILTLFQTHLDASQIGCKSGPCISLTQATKLKLGQLPTGCQVSMDFSTAAPFMVCVPVPRTITAAEAAYMAYPLGPQPPAPPQILTGRSFNSGLNFTGLTGKLDLFTFPAAAFQLAGTPAVNSPIQVFLNGILMCSPCGTDYQLTGGATKTLDPVTGKLITTTTPTVLTFVGQNTASMQGIILQVWYWVSGP
jgi:hypothetical protein